jgi:hypothetical protein
MGVRLWSLMGCLKNPSMIYIESWLRCRINLACYLSRHKSAPSIPRRCLSGSVSQLHDSVGSLSNLLQHRRTFPTLGTVAEDPSFQQLLSSVHSDPINQNQKERLAQLMSSASAPVGMSIGQSPSWARDSAAEFTQFHRPMPSIISTPVMQQSTGSFQMPGAHSLNVTVSPLDTRFTPGPIDSNDLQTLALWLMES